MNSRYRSVLIATAAASLVAFAQAQSSTGQSTSGASRSTGATSSSSSASPSTSQSQTGSSRDMTGSDRSQSMSSSAQGLGSASTGASSLQRVTRDSLDQQLTAKALIGKNVHDSAGEKIGEVQDIVLDSSRLPELASAFVNRENNRNTASAGATGARGTDTYAAGAAGDGASTSATRTSRDSQLSDLGNQARSMVQGAMSSGPAAIVSSGGVMGIGGDLIRVPLSQLRYDAAEDRVTLDVSREQISRITETDASDTSRSAAE